MLKFAFRYLCSTFKQVLSKLSYIVYIVLILGHSPEKTSSSSRDSGNVTLRFDFNTLTHTFLEGNLGDDVQFHLLYKTVVLLL